MFLGKNDIADKSFGKAYFEIFFHICTLLFWKGSWVHYPKEIRRTWSTLEGIKSRARG